MFGGRLETCLMKNGEYVGFATARVPNPSGALYFISTQYTLVWDYAQHNTILLELWILFDYSSWKGQTVFLMVKIYSLRFIDIDIDVSMQRVLKRHIATGKEPDVAAWRVILSLPSSSSHKRTCMPSYSQINLLYCNPFKKVNHCPTL